MEIKTGLQPRKKDRRDFSYHKTFGVTLPATLPSEYLLLTDVLNQGGINACTAYSATAVKEAEFGVQFDPLAYFDEEAIINGSANSEGYDLKTLMKTGVVWGSKPISGGDPSTYKDLGYYSVHASMGMDLYDAIKSAMWNERNKKRAVLGGLMWYQDWLTLTGGVIMPGQNPLGLHAVKLAGWKQIRGTEYLVVQNSFGTNYGDSGLFYFTRAQVNQYFTEGCFIWSDNPNDPMSIKTISMLQNFLNALSDFAKTLYNYIMISQEPTIVPDQSNPQPAPPIQPTQPTKVSKLVPFCQAIEAHENAPKVWNNPGAFRYNNFTKTFAGVTGQTLNGFCQFKDYASGFQALKDFVLSASINELKQYHDCTILSFFQVYSPVSDGNNSQLYATIVAGKINEKVDSKLKDFI